jgi:hypothetical protein
MKIKILSALLSATILTAGLSLNALADYDSDTDHDHTSKNSETHSSPNPMQEKMKAMQAEMQAIIDTEDTARRKAMFAAHKTKMMGMMQNMKGNCGKGMMMQHDKPEIDHQAETD